MSHAQGGITPDSIGRGYSATATDYDAAVRYNIEGAERLVAAMPHLPYSRVLDVGCGTGVGSLAMAERFPSVRQITAVDPSKGMLEEFRAKEEIEMAGSEPGGPFRRAAEFLPAGVAPIRPLLPALTFVRDSSRWGATFRFGIVRIPQADFARIALAMGRDSARDYPCDHACFAPAA